MTRQQVIEQIKRTYYGGIPSDDHNLSDAEVNLYINQAIGQLAVKNLRESIEIGGVESIGDAFYATFRGLSISKESDTGYYKATLPSVPVGLRKGHGISSVLFPSNSGVTHAPIEVSPREIEYMDMLPVPKQKVFWWVEGNLLYFKSSTNLTGKNAIVRMVANNGGVNDVLSVPSEYIGELVTFVNTMLRERKGTPEDNSNDGLDKF